MRTLGIDLASQPADTAVAGLDWPEDGPPQLVPFAEIETGAANVFDDSSLIEILRSDEWLPGRASTVRQLAVACDAGVLREARGLLVALGAISSLRSSQSRGIARFVSARLGGPCVRLAHLDVRASARPMPGLRGGYASQGRARRGSGGMSRKVSSEVMARLEHATEESSEIPVIVTLAQGTDSAVLESKGMRIRRVMENIPVVAGWVAVARLADLAELGEVERVEYDGEVHAL
jgi:hypothetical protein